MAWTVATPGWTRVRRCFSVSSPNVRHALICKTPTRIRARSFESETNTRPKVDVPVCAPNTPADFFRADAVLFDLDGTLTDSAPGIWAGFRHAMTVIGEPEPTDAMLSTVVGPPLLDSFVAFGLDTARAEEAVGHYRARYDERGWAENAVYDGIAAVLSRLHDAGVVMGVATSKNEVFAHRIVKHFGLAQYFDFVAGAAPDGSRRTKSDVIAHALAGIGRAPIRAVDGGTPGVVVVGDRIHDVDGAAVWGIPSVFVTWGYGSDAERTGARWTVSSVDELADLLLTSTTDTAGSTEDRSSIRSKRM